jgi:hypothetical protein
MAKAKAKPKKKTLTPTEAVAFQKYLDTLKEADKKTLLDEVDAVANTENTAEVKRAKEALEFYYDVKEDIEAAVIEALLEKPIKGGGKEPSRLALKAAGDNGWSGNKILKIIANLPNKMPDKDEGYITAARNIEVGKKKRPTKEQIEKKKQVALERKQEAARQKLFQKEVSDRKKAAEAKKKKPTPKKKASTKS